MTDLKGILTQEDLAYYIVLVCLSKFSRKELKENILTNSAILSLLEQNPDTVDCLEDFMLGRFEKLQRQLNIIEQKLKYDAYFGAYTAPKVYKQIRVKTLQAYVKPYKVIDMKEISSAFGVPLEQIETELQELIASGAIKAKIDSYKKLMHAQRANPQIDSYKGAVQLGEKFIRDTEDMMLKINLVKSDKVLDFQDIYKMKNSGVYC